MNNEERYSKPVIGRVFTLRERKDSPRIDSLAYRDVFIRTEGKRDFINLRSFSLAVWGMNT